MKATSTIGRILIVVASAMMVLLSATLAWGVVNDYQTRGVVPVGVTVAGESLAGMTEAQAAEAIEAAVSTPMLRPVTVVADGKSFTLDPAQFVVIDTQKMLDEAYSTRRTASLAQRISSDLMDEPLPLDVKPVYSVDASGVAAWVANTAKGVDHKAKNAKRTVKGYKFKITPGVEGVKLEQEATVNQITDALSPETALNSSQRVVVASVKATKPKVTEKSFKNGIIVSISQRKIYLYKGDKLVKTYRCAPGRPQFPTPQGEFKINRKAANAPWINPGSDWAKSMPPSIPAGPSNPMGVRKIGINYPGIFFHGIPASEYSSIGTAASHGCMRMMPSAVLDLYGRVKVGDPVYIKP